MVPQPWLWTTVHKLLTSFQRDIFQAELSRGDPMDLHRLTLFKRLRFRCWVCKWPWSGWLVPIERSGHTTQSTAAVFRAPDEAKRAEGVAGNTWRASVVIFRENLPDVSSAAAPPQDVADYARQTWTTPELVARRRPSARSYVGIPLDVNGKPWGVVVLDSTDAACKRSDADLRAYALLQAVLGKILERE